MRISDWSSDVCSSDLRGYAAELLDGGCSTQQAWSARWGGVCAINGSPSDFEDAVAAMREARRETGMSERLGSKEEAEAMYLAAATAVVTLQHPQIGRAECRERVCNTV